MHQWPKCWSFSISPSNEYSGLISFRSDRLGLLAAQGAFKSLLQQNNLKASVLQHSAFFMVQLPHPSDAPSSLQLYFFYTALHFDTKRCSRFLIINIFRPNPGISHFSKETRLCLLENGIKNQIWMLDMLTAPRVLSPGPSS